MSEQIEPLTESQLQTPIKITESGAGLYQSASPIELTLMEKINELVEAINETRE
tara:strand:+ start:499 stop:660 length:162 start_codon:yes stop_codon:yes gene_type:complete